MNLLNDIAMDDRGTKGDLYEYMLSKIASAGARRGFTGDDQLDFFLETDRLSDLRDSILPLVDCGEIDNRAMYELVLKKGFRPKHANEVLRQLCDESVIHTVDAISHRPARKGSFKLTHKEFKTNTPSIIYRAGSGE